VVHSRNLSVSLFFNSFMTVSVLTPNSLAVARIPAPSAARLITAFFTSGLQHITVENNCLAFIIAQGIEAV
jgi:hypothetical protein